MLYPLVPEVPEDVAGDTCPLLQSSGCCALPSPSVTEGVGEEACKVPANSKMLPFKGKILTLEAATALVSPRVGRRSAGETVTHDSLNHTRPASQNATRILLVPPESSGLADEGLRLMKKYYVMFITMCEECWGRQIALPSLSTTVVQPPLEFINWLTWSFRRYRAPGVSFTLHNASYLFCGAVCFIFLSPALAYSWVLWSSISSSA